MPGAVFRGQSSDPAGVWKDGKLMENDGVGIVLAKRGAEYFPGRSSTPAWRVRDGIVYRGSSSEPYCRLGREGVYKGNSSEFLYRLRGDGLLAGSTVAVRGAGLTIEELALSALVLLGA
jgi:hypothetical protein